MTRTIAFSAALLVGAIVGLACGQTTPKCSVASCAGCCDAMGACQDGKTATACGSQGNSCSTCSAGQGCAAGVCSAGATGGGSAGGSAAAGGAASAGGTASAGGAASAGGSASAGGRVGGGAGGGGGQLVWDAGMPPTVPITFAATCTSPAACGGAVPGLWHYQHVCIEDGLLGRAQQLCGGAAQTQIFDKMGTARGAIFFTDTQVARSIAATIDFSLTTTNSTCVNGIAGVGGCTNLPSLLANAGITGTCALALPDGGASASTCTCTLHLSVNDQVNDTYTVANNTITTGGNRTFEYCVQGTSMTHKETTPTSATSLRRDPGISTLSKQ